MQLRRFSSAPWALIPLLSGALVSTASALDAIVNFSEVMYHPRDGEVEWVEVHNMMTVDVDLSEWKLAGGIEFTFPVGTIIAGGGFLVVEGEGGGANGVLGPFAGRLDNNGEAILLHNNSGRLMDELEYGDSGRWPVAPDGSGASLAKRSPRLGSVLPENWTASTASGGTPGEANAENQALPLQISEVSGAGAPSFWIELVNAGSAAVQTNGLLLENPSMPGGGVFTLAHGPLPPGERLVLDEATLGFAVADEGRLFLTTAGGAQVLDAVRVKNRPLARREGASPSDRFLTPDEPTPDAPNLFAIEDAIVINEIMYHHRPQPERAELSQPFAEIDEEWIELYHRGTEPVDLTGWSLDGTISFAFPDLTVMNPGEYLVVARNAEELLAKHPGISIAGEFSGRLNNDHGYVKLEDAVQNPADELHYYDGGRWPGAADGKGSSLELRNPDADNSVAEAWAASDETGRSSWQTFTYLGRGQPFPGTRDPTTYHEFICGLLDAGECLLDDISVIEDPNGEARQLIQNGDFDNNRPGAPPARWRLVGTHGLHERSVVVDNPDGPGRVLHLVATGPMWHTQNQAETTLKDGGQFVTISASKVYEISFRAKWLTGSPHLNTRLYFNRVAETHVLPQPDLSGTPGAPNSTAVENLGPTSEEFRHFPVRPARGEAARVQARVTDPDGVAKVTLHWSTDGRSYTPIAMTDQGDGLYLGTIPGQQIDTKVQFFLEAEDALGATATYPAGGRDSRALYRVGEESSPSNRAQHIEIVMLPGDETILATDVNVMSNHRFGATVIYEDEVFYDVGVRLKSSQRGRLSTNRRGFNIAFHAEQPFRGVLKSIGLDRSGGWRYGRQFGQDEIVIWHYLNRAGGIPALHPDLVFLNGPGVPDGSAQLQLARYTNTFLEGQYENGDEGSIHNYELIYYPTTTTGGPEGLKRPQPDSVTGVPVRRLGDNKEAYRYYFQLRNNAERDDYRGIMGLCNFFSRSNSVVLENASDVIDVDQWLRVNAAVALASVGDSYFDNGNSHNARFYHRPSDGRMLLFPWDLDFAFVKSANAGLVLNSDLNRLLADSANLRRYWGHMQDIVNRSYRGAYMDNWIRHYNSFLTGQNILDLTNYIQQRASHALAQARQAVSPTDFAISTNGGDDFSSSDNPVVIEGDGWITVRSIRLAGSTGSLPVAWTDENSWRVELPLAAGQNTVTLEAIDFEGALVATDTITINNTSTRVAAGPDNFVLTEMMYHPATPSAEEVVAGFLDQEQFEFCEFQNVSASTVDASGVSFRDGIDLTLPEGTILAPGERLVVVSDAAAFAARYGAAFPDVMVAADYGSSGTSLRNSGERILILAGDGRTLLDFSYGDDPPWPVSADGAGYSLVPIAPAHPSFDPNDPARWRSSAAIGGHPGESDAISYLSWSAQHGGFAPLDDPEGDGIPALVEYTSGGTPQTIDPSPEVIVTPQNPNEFFVVIAIGADDTIVSGELSPALQTWETGDVTYAGTVNNGDGTRTLTFRQTGATAANFARIRYSLRE